MPKKIIPNLKTLPVKGVERDVESDDEDTKDFCKLLYTALWTHGNQSYDKIKKSNHKGSRIIYN